ncbi:glycosyltransferase family 8 protein [bacterium]|nr:glycosyltransferase family 8 protein [bacterium]
MINVCFIADNNYVLPTMTAINSIVSSNKREVNVFVVACELTRQNIDLLESLSKDGVKVKVIVIDKNPYGEVGERHSHVSKAAMLKFALPQIFSDLDKMLYLDGDILVLKDLSNLYNVDLEDNYVAAVIDMAGELHFKQHRRINTKRYFNSGVMLLNLKKMREDDITQALLENKKKDTLRTFMDQDAFNITMDGKVIFLSPEYNMMRANLFSNYIYSINKIANYYHTSISGIKDKINNPTILHLTSNIKPWKTTLAVDFELWFKELKKLPDCEIKNRQIYLLNKELRRRRKESFIKNTLRSVFSVRNDGVRKVVTILGLKFKFINTRLLSKKYKELNVRVENLYKEIRMRDNLRNFNKEKVASEIENFKGYGLNTEEKRDKKIIVSMTSYPARMYDVHYAIYSLLNQTLKPDGVVLWLTSSQFPNGEADIPKKVLDLKAYGLTIKWCDEYIKAYTKLVPSLREFPEDIIVTADDDIYYGNDWLEKLYKEYERSDRKTIIAHRCHKILIDDENQEIFPYNNWIYTVEDGSTSYLNFLTGVGGVLYPPNTLAKDACNSELFRELSPVADDIWFWAMAVLNDTKIKILDQPNQLVFINPDRELNLSEDGSLSATNVAANFNDYQLGKVLEAYPSIKEKIFKENKELEELKA